MSKATDAKFAAILVEAHNAARNAVAIAATQYDEMAGGCGFAWVNISGTEPLARYCRMRIKQTPDRRAQLPFGDKGYPSGWQFWNPGNHGGQRVDIKEAGAKAFRDALGKHGISAVSGSRLD